MSDLRITPEQVIEAYKETKLTPKQGAYLTEDTSCACGLGVVYVAKKPDFIEDYEPKSQYYINLHMDRNYGEQYRIGFVHGFDGINDPFYKETYKKYPDQYERYEQGREDGLAAWGAVRQTLTNSL